MLPSRFNSEYAALQSKVILNVDDNEMNVLVISKILEKFECVTVVARNGAEAVQALKDGLRPDAILMDLQMPVMTGLQATQIIKKEIDADIPIIINSGDIDAVQRWKLSRLGVKEFLEKPYSLKDIFSKLTKTIPVFEG
jgi:CheY-like chemotaxis protein